MTEKVRVKIKAALQPPESGLPTTSVVSKLQKRVDEWGGSSLSEQHIAALDIDEIVKVPENDYYRPRKKQISIRMDADVLAWFQSQSGKYQRLINKACRLYMRIMQLKQRFFEP